MKKVTLFLSVLIFATSLTSCYLDDDHQDVSITGEFVGWLFFGKVTQKIPDATEPEIYKFDEDFTVTLDENLLTIKSSFTEGGKLHIEATQSEESSSWIITEARIDSSRKESTTRFTIDSFDPTSIAILELNALTNSVELQFDLIMLDVVEQKSLPMHVSYEGNYQ